MYRVCIGYVSGMRRVCVETNKSIQCLLKTVKVIYWKTRIKICKYKKKTVPLQGILGIGYWILDIGYWVFGYGVLDMGYL